MPSYYSSCNLGDNSGVVSAFGHGNAGNYFIFDLLKIISRDLTVCPVEAPLPAKTIRSGFWKNSLIYILGLRVVALCHPIGSQPMEAEAATMVPLD